MTLPEEYHRYISKVIDEKGIYPHQLFFLTKDDTLHLCVLDLNSPKQVMNYISEIFEKNDVKELIFSLDRYFQPNQGIELADFLAGAYWDGEWKPFIIEYQNEPRIVKKVNWYNPVWNNLILEEIEMHENKIYR